MYMTGHPHTIQNSLTGGVEGKRRIMLPWCSVVLDLLFFLIVTAVCLVIGGCNVNLFSTPPFFINWTFIPHAQKGSLLTNSKSM